VQGQKLIRLYRRAKYLLFVFNNGQLISHLGMSGSFVLKHQSKTKAKHDHACLVFDNNIELWYNAPRRFGCLLWHDGHDSANNALLNNLGVEPLDNTFDGRYLQKCAASRRTAIKNVIMDAQVVVGVGNIYACEALFKAGVRPDRQAFNLSAREWNQLASSTRTVLARAIDEGGTSLKNYFNGIGNPGNFQHHLDVYNREGEPCRNCGVILANLGVNKRQTVYCPGCQH
jgi:formamidopyrimidine-DNA glycosylase